MEYLRSNFLKLRDVSGTQRCTVVRLITLRKKGRHARIPAARKKRGTAEGKRFNCEDISYMEVIGTAHVPRRRNGAERLMGPPRASQHSNIFNGLFRASYLNAIPRYLTVVWTHHRGQRLSYLSRRLKKAPPPSGTEDEEKLREEGKKNPRDEEEDLHEEEEEGKVQEVGKDKTEKKKRGPKPSQTFLRRPQGERRHISQLGSPL